MRFKRIACCVDFSENAEKAFVAAVETAAKFGAKLYILHVVPPIVNPVLMEAEVLLPEEPKQTLLSSVQERMQQTYASKVVKDIAYELCVLDGHVSTKIISFLREKNIDLAIMGSYGESGMGLVIFGSIAKRVAHRAPCSVMIVRDKEKAH